MRIAGKDDAVVDDNKEILRLFKKLGPGKVMKKMFSICEDKAHGSPELREEFKNTCIELFPEFEVGSKTDVVSSRGSRRQLRRASKTDKRARREAQGHG